MFVVCGNSLEDLMTGIEQLMRAYSAGATCGVGGSTLEEVLKSVEMMKAYLN